MQLLFVRGDLSHRHAVITQVIAVVGSEEYIGIVELPIGLEGIDNLLDALVDRLEGAQPVAIVLVDVIHLFLGQEGAVADIGRFAGHVSFVIVRRARRFGVREKVGMAGGRRVRGVRRIRGDVHKKWLAGLGGALDEVDRFAHVDIRAVILRLAAIRNLLAILVEDVIIFSVSDLAIHGRVPLIPAGRNVGYTLCTRILIQVFTGQHGFVSSALQPDGDGGVFFAEVIKSFPATQGQVVGENLGIVRVLPALGG